MRSVELLELGYYSPETQSRLTVYADTLIYDPAEHKKQLRAVRFGGYPEMVQAMSDAISAGGTIEVEMEGTTHLIYCTAHSYRRQIAHDGVYATSTMMVNDDAQTASKESGNEQERDAEKKEPPQPRRCYLFGPEDDRDRLFEELDRKTAAPLIPEFRDYVLDTLIARGDLRKLTVYSLRERMDAWMLILRPEDKNVIEVLEEGLQSGAISIPGSKAGQADSFAQVNSVTAYLNAFGVTVADRIRDQFDPLFDPASEPLSKEILDINDFVQQKAGYSLYDAQLAVAEAIKRRLAGHKTAIIRAECGSGKTKIGAAALGALHGMHAAQCAGSPRKTFNVVLAPAHVTRKWVREIGETLPDTYGMVISSVSDLKRLYALYEQGDKHVYAVISKEKARDGYMRYPAVIYRARTRTFHCPDCMKELEMVSNEDGMRMIRPADQFFFQRETKQNHKCPCCGSPLWAPVDPGRQIGWVKIGGYGWVHRRGARAHLEQTKDESIRKQIMAIVENPDGYFTPRGAVRRYPLSTYVKKKMRGRIDGFLADELHEYNNASGQGDAMAELYGVCRKFVGMTATLINGYSSGIFHLLYRIAAGLMRKDGQNYRRPADFDAEYGVVENTYEVVDAAYNANRRASKRKTRARQLPGVSPLVFSRFLLECTAFLQLTDMGKDLPDYEEIPVPLAMPVDVRRSYKKAEGELNSILKSDRRIAQKILSAYMGLLTVYPDQPYGQPPIVHPISGRPLVTPEENGDFARLYPKEEKTLEIVRAKLCAGERVLIYTSWTRTDSQQKLLKLLREEGFRTDILTPSIPPDKREEWVDQKLAAGLDVLITNPRCVETGLDLNAFTTLIFYSMGYNLFTLRQASRRSWRINQTAPRVEVYLLYYMDTMQAKAMKLMASKLAVAGIIEGTFTDEGLAAMSDVRDLTSQMAKELAAGIRDNVEDIAAAYKRMAIINPERRRTTQSAQAAERTSQAKEPLEMTLRFVEARQTQKRYDGLLEKSIEVKKKRSKKVVVDQNQMTIFGFVA